MSTRRAEQKRKHVFVFLNVIFGRYSTARRFYLFTYLFEIENKTGERDIRDIRPRDDFIYIFILRSKKNLEKGPPGRGSGYTRTYSGRSALKRSCVVGRASPVQKQKKKTKVGSFLPKQKQTIMIWTDSGDDDG